MDRERKTIHGQKKRKRIFPGLILSLTLSCLFLSQGLVWAGTYYYVDSALADTHPASATPDCTTYNPTTYVCGTGSSSAYKTIADINASSFSPGDSILFRKGESWREQLNYPSSGSAGNPITFGTYGTGAAPIISGSDLITGGWTKDSTHIWKATVTTQPNIVYLNSTRGIQVADKAHIVAEFNWFWGSGVLYVWSPNDDDPSGHYTTPGIEAGARSYGVLRTNDKSYVTANGLAFRGGNEQGINVGSVSVTGIVFQNCIVERNSEDGFILKGSSIAHDVTIDHCTIQDNGNWGIAVSYQYTASSQISNNLITRNGLNSIANSQEYSQIDGILGNFNIFGNTISETCPAGCNQSGSSGDFCHGIYYSAGFGGDRTIPANIYQNTSYNNPYGVGIKAVGSANIYQNTTYGNHQQGISLGQNDSTNVVFNVYDNVIYGNGNSGNDDGGIVELNKGAGTIALTIENNTVYQNGNTNGHEIKIEDSLEALTIKNNILWATPTRRTLGVIFAPTGTVSIDYNLHWRADGAPSIRYGDTYPTWAQWQDLGFDRHGVNADPLFTNAAGNIFTLQGASPAIDAGTNVGLTQDILGGTVPQGRAPDMGAYEFQGGAQSSPPAAPSGLRIR